MKSIFTAILAALLANGAMALPRDKTELSHFKRDHACPLTGKTSGRCDGYNVDHKKALMNGGADKPANMQWTKTSDHKRKTREDFDECKASPSCLHRGMKHSK